MKMKFFFVGVIVAITMGAIFISCEKKTMGTFENGCTCVMTDASGSETEYITPQEMRETAEELADMGYILSSCSDYSDYAMRYLIGEGGNGTISCR